MIPIEPKTPRLRLRQWKDADLAAFAALNADPRVMEFFPSPLSRDASDAMAERCRAAIAGRGWGLWAVEVRKGAAFIGYVGLNVPTVELPFSPCVEIGWRLAFEHWGKGYATEAAREVLRIGFEMLVLDEVVSFTALSNLRSQAVMRRLDMHRDPNDFDHPAVPLGSPLRRHCLYRLSRGTWSRSEVPFIPH